MLAFPVPLTLLATVDEVIERRKAPGKSWRDLAPDYGRRQFSISSLEPMEELLLYQPLNRQSEQYAREGIELSVSTMADHVGACAATLMPLHELIKAHVFAAERIHGDDTTVPVLAKGKCRTGRIWTYVRDDRPFGGKAPPAAVFFYSADRTGIHPEQHLAG